MNMNILSVKVETNPHNHDSTAWFAYFKTIPSKKDIDDAVFEAEHHTFDSAPLGIDRDPPEEIPDNLSKNVGIERWLIGFTC